MSILTDGEEGLLAANYTLVEFLIARNVVSTTELQSVFVKQRDAFAELEMFSAAYVLDRLQEFTGDPNRSVERALKAMKLGDGDKAQ